MGPFVRAWSLESYNVGMISPRFSRSSAAPLAWSSPTNGVQSGEPVYAPFESSGFDLEKNKEAFEKYQAKWKGKLRGKIVLISEAHALKPATQPNFRRYTDAELAEMAQAPEPFKLMAKSLDIKMPTAPEEVGKLMGHLPSAITLQFRADVCGDPGSVYAHHAPA